MYSKKTAIYVHFPYCAQRCPYCDFNVHIKKQIPQLDLVNSLLTEARTKSLTDLWKGRQISTLFFGGGTPSLFEPTALSNLICGLKEIWHFDHDLEVSLEANPENIDQHYSEALLQCGINRLSIGIQSLQDNFLSRLGRIHSAEKAKQAVRSARQAGFKNINIDLMFALPEQSLNDLKVDLLEAISLEPDHISYYNLTIEKGTNFFQRQAENKLETADDTLSAEMMETIIDSLDKADYQHYEISNYARAGKQCKHNLGYWQLDDYLGLGPGAHSAYQLPGSSQIVHLANISEPNSYIKKANDCTAWTDTVVGKKFLFEKIMLGLRVQRDFDLQPVLLELNESEQSRLLAKLKVFESDSFLTINDTKIKLSKQGMMILDSLLAEIAECLKG